MSANKGTLVVSQHLFTGKQHYVDYSQTLIGPQRETSKKKHLKRMNSFRKIAVWKIRLREILKGNPFFFFYYVVLFNESSTVFRKFIVKSLLNISR